MTLIVVCTIRSQWEWTQGQCMQWKYGTTIWEDGDLDEKLKVQDLSKTVGLVDHVGSGT